MLLAATLMTEAPDLYVNSSVDPDTLDVAAFEPLVGCHGGLGGWQDRGLRAGAARSAAADVDRSSAASSCTAISSDILETLGHRTDLARSTP